jgi:CRISPR-associated protein Cas1
MIRRLSTTAAARPHCDRLAGLRDHLARARDPGVLRGFEGSATQIYYQGFALRIRRDGFAFKGRTKRPPRDPLNSLLSFTYSLVFAEMQTALLADGLDPHPGLLHDLRANHPALASDLVEPYRVLIADSFVLKLVNNEVVKVHEFEKHRDGGTYLEAEARRRVLDTYESFIDPGGAPALAPRRLIHAAARSMLRVVLGETEQLQLPLSRSQVPAEDEQEDAR